MYLVFFHEGLRDDFSDSPQQHSALEAACAGRLHDFISVAAQSSYKVTAAAPGIFPIRSAVG